MADTISINGVAYAAKDIEILWLGAILRGVTEINWSEDVEVDKTYVLGTRKAIWRTEGKEDCKGEMTLLSNTVAAIEIQAKASLTELGDSDLTIVFKSFAVPLKKVLRGLKVNSKSQTITGGNAGALAEKCGFDLLEVSPMMAA